MSGISRLLASVRSFVVRPAAREGLVYERFSRIVGQWKLHQTEMPKLTKELRQFEKTLTREESPKKPPVDGDILRLDLSKTIKNPGEKWQDIIHNRNKITPTHPDWSKSFWDNLKSEK